MNQKDGQHVKVCVDLILLRSLCQSHAHRNYNGVRTNDFVNLVDSISFSPFLNPAYAQCGQPLRVNVTVIPHPPLCRAAQPAHCGLRSSLGGSEGRGKNMINVLF